MTEDSKKILRLDIRTLPSFYYPSNLYMHYIDGLEMNNKELNNKQRLSQIDNPIDHEDMNNLMEENKEISELNEIDANESDYWIQIPTEKYWHIQHPEESICNLATNIPEMIRLFSICDYWGFEELPILVLRSYHMLSTHERNILKYHLINIQYMGYEFQQEIVKKLECFSKDSWAGLYQTCALGYIDIFHFLISYHLKEMFWSPLKTDEKRQAFKIACRYGHLPIVKFFFEQQIDGLFDIHNMNFSFLEACSHNQVTIVKYMLEENLETSMFLERSVASFYTTFLYVCTNNHKEVAKYFLQNTFLPEFITNRLFHSFINACTNGHVDIVRYLLESNTFMFRDINQTNEIDLNGFYFACMGGHLEVIRYLIENPICRYTNLGFCNKYKTNGFMYACIIGSEEIVRYLIENETCVFREIEATNENKDNALMLACSFGHMKIVKYLIENKICSCKNIRAKNKNHQDILQISKLLPNQMVYDYLLPLFQDKPEK